MDPNPDTIKEELNRFRHSVSENFNKVQKVISHFVIHNHFFVFQLDPINFGISLASVVDVAFRFPIS